MANKRITDVDFIDSLDGDESFFVNKNSAIKQTSKQNIVEFLVETLPNSGLTDSLNLSDYAKSKDLSNLNTSIRTDLNNMNTSIRNDLKTDLNNLNTSINNNLNNLDTGVHMKLLWTNPDASSSFGEKTISVDLSGYQLVLVFYRNTSKGNVYCSSIGALGINTTCAVIGGNEVLMRRVFLAKSTGVDFATAKVSATYGSPIEDNTALIPYKIYGIKGVL